MSRRRPHALPGREADQFGVGELEIADHPSLQIRPGRANRSTERDQDFGGILGNARVAVIHGLR
jgi:hypothetical protein